MEFTLIVVKFLYLTWNKEDNLKNQAKLKGPEEKILTKKKDYERKYIHKNYEKKLKDTKKK